MPISVFPEFQNVRAPQPTMADLVALMGNGLNVGYGAGQMIQGVPQTQARLANELTAGKLALQPYEMRALETETSLAPLIAEAKMMAALADANKPFALRPGGALVGRDGSVIKEIPSSPTDPKATRELGTIDGRLVVRDPYGQTTYFEDTKEPVGDLSRLIPVSGVSNVYLPDPQGNVFGFPAKGPQAGKGFPATITTPTETTSTGAVSATTPFVKQTPQSEKITSELRAVEDADAMIKQMEELYNEIVAEGNTGVVKGNITKGLNAISGGAYSPKAQTYTNLKNGFLASMRGMTGDDARFSDADARRLSELLSGIELNPEAAALQWKEITGLLEKRKQIRWADEKLGKGVAPDKATGGSPLQNFLKKYGK